MNNHDSPEVETIGQYPLIRQLGKGGMGSVWYSEHPFLKIPCAIKILDAQLASHAPEFIQRFIQEGRLAAELNHPNVLRVFDADHDGDKFFMVLEYIDGCDVKKMAKERGGKLPVDEVLEIAYRIGDALKEAAHHNIIHRDIKPENILVTKEGELKLADLGIGKKINSDDEYSLTMTGVAIGTAYYISPEQSMDSKSIDHRSDIYSLGATMYKLLTGTYPFKANTPMAMMVKHANSPLDDPRERNPELPDNICAVVCKMMEKKPEDRYQTYEEFLDDITAIRNTNAPVSELTCTLPALSQIIEENAPTESPENIEEVIVQQQPEEQPAPQSVKKVRKRRSQSQKSSALVYSLSAAIVLLAGAVIYLIANRNSNSPITVETPENKKEPTIIALNTKKVPEPIKTEPLKKAPTVKSNKAKPKILTKEEEEQKLIDRLKYKLQMANSDNVTIKGCRIVNGAITHLDLSNNKDLKNLRPLNGLPLKELNLDNCPNLESLDGLQQSSLLYLSLESSQAMRLSSLAPLRNLPLRELRLKNLPELEDLRPLEESPLVNLSIKDCDRLRKLKGLGRLSQLQAFILDNCPRITLLPPLSTSLKKIELRNCGLGAKDLEVLYRLQLEEVFTDHAEFDNRYQAFIQNKYSHSEPNNGLEKINHNQPMEETGKIELKPLVSGVLHINNQEYKIEAKKALIINDQQAGDVKYELKHKDFNIKGVWKVTANESLKVSLPDSWLAENYKDYSSRNAREYLKGRSSRKDSKINELTEKALRELITKQNSDGSWGEDHRGMLTPLVAMAMMVNRENLYNSFAKPLDRSIRFVRKSLKHGDRRNESFPIIISALGEAYALTGNQVLGEELSQAVRDLIKSQSENGAFNVFDPGENKHHMGYSPWAFEALKICYLAGIETKSIKNSLKQASKSLMDYYDKNNSKTGPFVFYAHHGGPGPGGGPGGGPGPGGGGPGPGGGPAGEHQPPEGLVKFMRAAAVFSLSLAGTNGSTSKLKKMVSHLSSRDIDYLDWHRTDVHMPMMTWYMSSLALFNNNSSKWNKWRTRLFGELKKGQEHNGCWESPSHFEKEFFHYNEEEADIFSTCMAILILNTEYRYKAHKGLP